MKKWIIAIVVIVLVIWGISAFSGNKAPTETGPIKIGFIAPLTGDAGSIGQGARVAVEIAIDKINSSGGINGRQIQLIAEDGKCSGKEALTVANKLINVDKVKIILGGVCSSETMSVAPIAEQNKIVLLSPGSSNPSITNMGDYIFRDYPSDSFEGMKAADYLFNVIKARKVAVFNVQNDWGVGIRDVFIKKFIELGGTVVVSEQYDPSGPKDYKTQLVKIKNSSPDALYLINYSEPAIISMKQFKELGINIPVFGVSNMGDPEFTDSRFSDGVMYPTPTSPDDEQFKMDMEKKTGDKGIVAGSSQAYDAMNILAMVMRKVGNDSDKIKDELYKVKDYPGVSGNISFDQNGDLASVDYIVKIIKNGQALEMK